jgi:hypothetical protein
LLFSADGWKIGNKGLSLIFSQAGWESGGVDYRQVPTEQKRSNNSKKYLDKGSHA